MCLRAMKKKCRLEWSGIGGSEKYEDGWRSWHRNSLS